MPKRIMIFLVACLWLIGSAVSADCKILSVDLYEANLLDALRALTRDAGLNLVVGSNLNLGVRRVTLHLKEIDALQAIDHLLRINGYTFERADNTLLVSGLPQDAAVTAYRPKTEILSLRFISTDRALAFLGKLFPAAVVLKAERSNSILIKGKPSEVEEAIELLKILDQPVPQVLIECKVVEVSESGLRELGVNYGKVKFAVDKNTGQTRLLDDILLTVNTLVTKGEARIMASPRIATMDDREAVINIGNKIPYAVPVNSGSSASWTVQYIDAGVRLKITPRLLQSGFISTAVQTEVSSLSEWRSTPAGEFPVISTRNAEASLQVKDGQTIIIGGLISETERENLVKIPILGDLPLLGMPFQSRVKEKAKTDIVFLITPHLVK